VRHFKHNQICVLEQCGGREQSARLFQRAKEQKEGAK
jgi:hypothetical protein